MRSFAGVSTRRRLCGTACAVLFIVAGAVAAAGQRADEADPRLAAATLLGATPLAGDGYAITAEVATPGNYHVFTITSPFGTFEAEGRAQVDVRLQEIAALGRLQELSRAGVFARAAGESVVKVGAGVVNAVSDPVATAKGIGGGVKRFGLNLGRRTRRAVQRLTDDDKTDADGTDASAASKAGDAAGSVAKSLIGINSARRRWARRVGADPYTTNPVLKAELERVAAVDAAGGIAASIVVPVPPIIGTTADIGDLVWGTDPEELRKLNESRARDVKAPAEAADAFFRNRNFTLTMQTRLVAALAAVNVPGVGDYLASASEADDEREALFFVESGEMLQREHEASSIAAVLTDSRAIVARRPSGETAVLLPLDWVRAAPPLIDEFTELAARARAELGATSLRVRVSGTITDRAAAALATIGWQR